MDLDADGHDDVITGSYWPGHVYWFRGLGDGEFAEATRLVDEDGADLHAGMPWKSDDEPDMNSLAAVPCAFDYDGDGDFDLLVGNIVGGIVRIENVGSAKKPVFGKTREPLRCGGEPFDVSGDSGPTVADWDGDGRLDLVVGSDDGRVVWCRNVAETGPAQFARPVELLPTSPQGWDDIPFGGEPKGHGVRAKVCAADWNRDGLLDLLVGDFVQQARPPLELTDEQIARRDALRTERDDLMRKMQDAGEDGPPVAVTERWSKVWEELSVLEPRPDNHGFVWVYLRRAPAAGSESRPGRGPR